MQAHSIARGLARAGRSGLLRGAGRVQFVAPLGTNIAGGSMGRAWADKEHAQENQYFSKQEAENLARLAAKLHLHAEPSEELIASAREELTGIFAKHSVTPTESLIEDILKFKFNKQ